MFGALRVKTSYRLIAIVVYPVSTAVNTPKNNTPDLIEPMVTPSSLKSRTMRRLKITRPNIILHLN